MNSTPTIFVVEDEALIAMELQDQLESLGYRVCGHAARGEIALEKIRELQPDLILMDINLAGAMTGIDTAEQLGRGLAVIFLSAYSDPALVSRAVSTGPFGYLIKPFNPRELHATIEVALHQHRAKQELQRTHQESEERVSSLQQTLQQTAVLPDQLIVCPQCRMVHVEGDGWASLECYIGTHAPAKLSYTVCPHCSAVPSAPPSP